ncbi:MAG: cryptochrome/photolyase family protein [Fimbriimonadaceae bacterium]
MKPQPGALVLGDNLFPHHSSIPDDARILMVEDWGLCRRVRHHKLKIVFFLAAMRHHARALQRSGRPVSYFRLEQSFDTSFHDRLRGWLIENRIVELSVYEPNDRYMLGWLHRAADSAGCRLRVLPSPAFLTDKEAWRGYTSRYRRRFLAEFYAWQRRRLGVLCEEDGSPVGGKWSFDTENRKPWPSGRRAPEWPRIEGCGLPIEGLVSRPDDADPVVVEVEELVERYFSDHPGAAGPLPFPATRSGALQWLERFVTERLSDFGPYEDAIARSHPLLHHSLLTPYLNCGLVTPTEVLARVLIEKDRIPLPSLEGFVRQLIGWREFVRGIDRDYGERYAACFDEEGEWRVFPNRLGATRRLGPEWWSGTTGLPPLDGTIRRVLATGWAHHIERLMVVGSAMLMCEVEPGEAYRWFMEMFVDSADWVMAPNVLGMSQFADGGYFATKPYLSASASLRKMTDDPKGPWCEVWDGLYWRFVDRHREVLAANPRLSVMVGGVDRLKPDRRAKIFEAAERFIERVTAGP